MIGLYLDTLKSGHTFCSKYNSNELTLQKELQNVYVNNDIFRQK